MNLDPLMFCCIIFINALQFGLLFFLSGGKHTRDLICVKSSGLFRRIYSCFIVFFVLFFGVQSSFFLIASSRILYNISSHILMHASVINLDHLRPMFDCLHFLFVLFGSKHTRDFFLCDKQGDYLNVFIFRCYCKINELS